MIKEEGGSKEGVRGRKELGTYDLVETERAITVHVHGRFFLLRSLHKLFD